MQNLRFRISKITIFVGAFIIASASFVRQAIEFMRGLIGKEAVVALTGSLIIGACLALLIYVIKKKGFRENAVPLILVLTAGLILVWQIETYVERIHLMEYGILGWMATRDLMKDKKRGKDFILACLFCMIAGILDEAFQMVLPYRVFDIRDIAFNALGGVWGAVLYLMS